MNLLDKQDTNDEFANINPVIILNCNKLNIPI